MHLAHAVDRLQLDRLVFDLRARGAAVGDHQRAADHGAADEQRRAAGQRERGRSSDARPATAREACQGGCRVGVMRVSCSPSSCRSTASHRQCSTSRCTSWMRAVRSCGTQMCTSVSPEPVAQLAAAVAGQRDHRHVLAHAPRPPRPARWPSCRSCSSASSTSPGAPSACTCLAKTCVEVVVVADRGEDRRVGGQRDRRQPGPLALEAADELGGEVLRVAGRAAVAAGQHLAAGGDAADARALTRVGDRLARGPRRPRTSGRRCRRTAAGCAVRAWSTHDKTRVARASVPRGRAPQPRRTPPAAIRCARRRSRPRRSGTAAATRQRAQVVLRGEHAGGAAWRADAGRRAAVAQRRARARTSTNTSVPSRSRRIRSISPPRARGPRATR